MIKVKLLITILVAAFLFLAIRSCSDGNQVHDLSNDFDLAEEVDYNFHIRALLTDRCFKCHGPDANQRKAHLRLDLADEAYGKTNVDESKSHRIIYPGKPGKSELYHRIVSNDPEYMMPPPESNLSLSPREKTLLKKWINEGAKYSRHWSFIPPAKPEIHELNNEEWPLQVMDRFILKRMEEQGLQPSVRADKATLLRRLSLDLTGLNPTPDDLDNFLSNNDPDLYENTVEQLMASPHYGERMALIWLDAARYADSHGYQDDGMRQTWPWRDWVIKSFNANTPYDQFLIEQIAGDLLPDPSKDQLLATCFNRNHPQTQEGGVVDEEYRVEYVADRTNTFGKALLGLTLECARCHDHKYEPISQEEYYAVYAYFNNNNDTGIVPYNGEASPTVLLPTPEEAEKLSALEQKMLPLKQDLVSDNYLDAFEKWYAQLPQSIDLKRGLVAHFDFDKELLVPANTMNLDNNPDRGENTAKVVAYLNKAKDKVDATQYGGGPIPKHIEGHMGKGIQFMGDAGIRFNRDLDFDRHHPFSVSLWVRLLKKGEEGPIFNKTNGDFEGYRGWLCKLNKDGTLSFQFNHVWPDNCIDFRTLDTLPVNEWTLLTLTYDGSSNADGIGIYINGQVPRYELLRDNLQKSLLHGVEGTNWSNLPVLIGMELRKSIENLAVDEFRVYNRRLSELEIANLAGIHSPEASRDDWFDHYLAAGHNDVYNEKLYLLKELRKEENLIATDVLETMIMQDRRKVRETYILDRGAYDAPKQKVSPKTPIILGELDYDRTGDRLELARWLTHPDHPLTARVAVNRIWNMLFGRGLVVTQEDFGSQGSLPTHPELLDYLAIRFIESGWDIKGLIKMIVTSATYQQSSVASEEASVKDVENKWYSHFPPHRLQAEIIRDNALVASSLLVRTIGGPSVYPYQPAGIWKALATRNATEYVPGKGEDLYRRSLYTIWKRSSPPPSMMNFDAPDRYGCTVRRQQTATPLQSLVLMNDPQFVEASRVLAENSIRQKGNNLNEQIGFIVKSLLGRSSTPQEDESLSALYEDEVENFNGRKQEKKALLRIGEQPFAGNLDPASLYASTLIAMTVMNYDEFVMKR